MAKKKSKFLGKVSTDAKRQKTAGASYGYLIIPKGVTVFSPTPGGRANLDIMPYEVTNPKHPDRNAEQDIAMPGTQWYKRPFKIHRSVGAENETVVCLTSFGKRCPICEYRRKRQGEGADKEELDSMKASSRNLYAVVPIGEKDWKEEIHVWDMSQFLFQNLLNDELEEDEEYSVFPDLEEGYTLKVRFDESSMGNSSYSFATASRIDFVDRDSTYPEDYIDDVPDLDKMLTELSTKEMELKFFEMEGEEDETTKDTTEAPEEEETSRRVRKTVKKEEKEKEEKKPTSRRKKVVKEEKEKEELQEQGEEVEFVEKEEKEEKPVKRERRAKKEEKPKKDEEEKCPHGLKFGVNIDSDDACDVCDIWDQCAEEEAKLKNQ